MQNADLSWTSIGTGFTAADGTFSVPVAVPDGITVRVVATPTAAYAPGTSASLVVSG
jgi:hypothetical protein